MSVGSDPWADWLLERQHGGDPDEYQRALEDHEPLRDRVLDGAEPLAGTTLLDVGTGEGLVALGALERVGQEGRVILSDVSTELLERSRDAVRRRGLLGRARFVHCDAEHLEGISNESVDVVTTRSVIAYVQDKASAFDSLYRALRPGGRISLFEPVLCLVYPEPTDRFLGCRITEVAALAERVKDAYDQLQVPAAQVLLEFDHRDLLQLAEQAGFNRIHMELHLEVVPGISLVGTREVGPTLDSAWHPLAPTAREAIARALDAHEQERFVAALAGALERGDMIERLTGAFLVAHKPTAERS
jgi:arsenite methyltransferase